MMRFARRTIAAILIITMLAQIVPLTVFAENDRASLPDDPIGTTASATAESTEEPVSAEKSEEEPYVTGELASLRTENEKHFRMSDGTYIAVGYNQAVHYADEDGQWQDIDNTLTCVTAAADSMMALSGETTLPPVYESKNGQELRQFAAAFQPDQPLFSMSNGAQGLSMSVVLPQTVVSEPVMGQMDAAALEEDQLLDADRSTQTTADADITAVVENPETAQTAAEELTLDEQVTPRCLTSSISYQNIWQNTILQYQPSGYHVKENIFVIRPQDTYEYTFRLTLDGLTPRQDTDGAIDLVDSDGAVVYTIPLPYMQDAAGEFSEAVWFELTADGDGYLLSVIADDGWLNEESRVFPVTIDPSVYELGTDSNKNILTSYVNSGRPSAASYNQKGYVRCGYYTNTSYDANCTGTCKGFIYVNKLPAVPEGCVVTAAALELYKVKHGGDVCRPELYTSVLSLTGDAESYMNNLNWNNHMNGLVYGGSDTASERVALDYVKETTSYGYVQTWDITSAAQKWYAGSTAISRLLVMDTGSTLTSNARATYCGYADASDSTHTPKLVVHYQNMVGIEDIYSYHTQSIGRAGTGYVNNFTLNLTICNTLLSSPSEVTPFSLSLFYNSPNGKSVCTKDPIPTKSYAMSTGVGWKTSVQQSVVSKQIEDSDGTKTTYLIYMDADGTEHYFRKVGTKYCDEDGLGLSITVSGSNYTMTDKEKNTWEFYNGYLTQYTDNNGNILFYAYDNASSVSASTTTWKPSSSGSHQVTSVWRKNSTMTSPVKIAALTYDSNGRLKTVSDQADRETTLDYTSKNGKDYLTSLTLPDGEKVYYAYDYDSSTYLSRAFDSEANYGIEYSYTNQQGEKRINNIYEYRYESDGTTIAYGQKMHAHKSNATYTRFRYYGADAAANTEDDIVACYAFDNFGRAVNIVSLNADESMVLGVSAGVYTQNSEADASNNRLTSATAGGTQGTNLLFNSGLEESNGTSDYRWIAAGGGAMALKTNTETSTDVTPRTGSYLLKLYATGGAAARSTAYQQVYLAAGKTYVFSAYVNTTSVTSFGDGGEAYLSIQDANDNECARSEVLTNRTNAAIHSGWVRLEVAYTPQSSGTYRASLNLKNTVNSVIAADDLQLEQVPDTALGMENYGAASSANLLQLGSFDIPNVTSGALGRSMTASFWTYDTTKACPVTTDKRSGYGMTFAAHPDGQRRASQTVPINGTSNTTYLLSGWGKMPACSVGDGSTLSGDNTTYQRFFGMIAKIVYSDTTTPEYHYVSFNDDYSGWQYAVGAIVPKRADKTITSITVTLACDYCPNRAYMDDVALIEEPVQTYAYDSKGNLTLSAKTQNDDSTFTYDSYDRLTGYTSVSGVSYSIAYSTTSSRDPASVTSDGIKTAYTYNSAGSVTQTKLTNSSVTRYIQSSAAYSADGNYLTSSTDVNGVTTSYQYDDCGRLETSSTANTQTTYAYTSADRVSTVEAKDGTQLSYTYAGGTLTRLSRQSTRSGATKWQSYSIGTDAWHRTTSIGVQSSSDGDAWGTALPLASYEYAENNGNLTKMTYANGQFVRYTYDILDRLVGEAYYNEGEEEPYAETVYVYNSNGALARQYRLEDGSVTEDYRFEYDSLGRLIRSRQVAGTTLAHRTEHLYDSADRLTQQRWIVGGTLFTEYYTYDVDDGSLTKVNVAGVGSVTYSYDALKILWKQLYTTKTGATFGKYYGQSSSSAGQVSPRTNSMAYRLGSTTDGDLLAGYNYTYNSEGGIQQVKDASTGKVIAKYTYDGQNQLTQETLYKSDGTADGVYQYTYDTAGNLLSVTKDSAAVGTYTYGNASWGDLLTAYNGQKIAYEGQTYVRLTGNVTGTAVSGNPISYYNGTRYTFTWENGRQLATASKSGTSVSYTYDINGIRSGKKVGSLLHSYLTENGQVVREDYGSVVLEFVYDVNGAPYALRYSTDSGASWDTYYYLLNLQGDVVKLVDTEGEICAEYTYNAWGKVLTATGTMATINPLRYRGYYYDTETGFYYLQSRYYDPITCRFINADSYASTGQDILGTNMFAYCSNCPVARSDPSGEFFGTLVGAIGGAIGGFIGAAINGDDPLKGALIGAETGAIAGAGVDFAIATGGIGGAVIAVAVGAGAGILDSAANDAANGRTVNWKSAGLSAGIGGVTNLLSFGLVDTSLLKSGGNIFKNFWSNGIKQLCANTTRKVAGQVALKSTAGVAKNIAKNVASGVAEAALISGFNAFVKREVQEICQ